jgi:hypothetical protein
LIDQAFDGRVASSWAFPRHRLTNQRSLAHDFDT